MPRFNRKQLALLKAMKEIGAYTATQYGDTVEFYATRQYGEETEKLIGSVSSSFFGNSDFRFQHLYEI